MEQYSCLRVFAISGYSTDGKPTITTATPFLAKGTNEKEINNISCEMTPDVSKREYNADNLTEKDEVKKGYNGTVKFYGIDKTAIDLISVNKKDSKGGIVLGADSDGAPKCVLFFQGKSEKGAAYNLWLYNVEFEDLPISSGQPSDSVKETSLGFYASGVQYDGKTIFGMKIYSDDSRYVTPGTDPTADKLPMPEKSA